MIVPPVNFTCPSILSLPKCTISTAYLEPGKGEAIIPWIFSLLLIFIHLPLVITKIVHFQSTITFSVFLAISSIIFVSLSYRTTNLSPEMVRVWAPLNVTLDIGAMMQIFAYLLEQEGHEIWSYMKRTFRIRRDWNPRNRESRPLMDVPLWLEDLDAARRRRSRAISLAERSAIVPSTLSLPTTHLNNPAQWSHLWAFVLLAFSASCITTLFGFQIFGLKRSISAYSRREELNLKATWCSPAFLLGIKVFDLECTYTPITVSTHFGTACIELQGDLEEWLLAISIILSIQLFAQVIDAIVLWRASSSTTFRGIKMRRPWATIILGIANLAGTTIVGLLKMHQYPMPAGTRVGIVTFRDGECALVLYPGGLRGSIIACLDGIFDGLGKVYHGLAP